MQSQMKEKVLVMKQTIHELDMSQTDILNRMTSNSTSSTSIQGVASKEILQLEEHVSRVHTQSIAYGNNLDTVRRKILALLMKTSRLNTLVDNLQVTTAFGEDKSKEGSTDMSTNDKWRECSLSVLENNGSEVNCNIPCKENCEASDEDNTEYRSDNECCSGDANIHNHPLNNVDDRKVPPLTHNAVKCNVSNINPYEPISEQNDTKYFKKLGNNSDTLQVPHAFTSTNKYRISNSDGSIQNESEIEQDSPVHTCNKKNSAERSSERKTGNIPKLHTRIRKNEYCFKSKTTNIQNDNRVTFHNNQESIGGKIDKNFFSMDPQRQESIVPNIEPTEQITDDVKPMMTSATSYSSFSRGERRRQEEDIYGDRLFDADQPKTVREWYQYSKQIKAYASARVRSGAVKVGRAHDVILVLDTSERMTGYFQKLKSAALQYVYGIQCGGMENGIGLAVFGRQTRLIQESTIDYELIIELIRQLRPDGDAPIIAGLLMGYAGVSACNSGRFQDVVIRAHMIVFTNGSSEQCKVSSENKDNYIFALQNDRVPSDVNGVIEKLTSSTTRIFYVPVGGDQCNSILEQAVRKTNGKIIQDNEMNRLIRMSRVMLHAITIASDIRYTKNHSRDDIRRMISNRSDFHDTHDDCLDMVQDYSNPLKFFNNRGLYMEIQCNTLKLGDRVRRGPDWTWDDQDLGLPGTVVGRNRDSSLFNKAWVLVEWDHGKHVYPYMYDEQMDTFHIKKVNEPRILVDEMIAVGCRVVRGLNWKYGDHDGGIGTLGTVLNLNEEGKVVMGQGKCRHI
ncbi:uncharacterized protein LOC127734535 isoform X2 [Mytilus californianus]|uniref:uncharacterized protein LOC127734535 isoform X2 n=1 Tax=Mytilus californianus TaxID=6549 RepID=UPI00224773CA|nr:uncharacterized protein LOC127734535 isoform X2 [Mytilus californianus]